MLQTAVWMAQSLAQWVHPFVQVDGWNIKMLQCLAASQVEQRSYSYQGETGSEPPAAFLNYIFPGTRHCTTVSCCCGIGMWVWGSSAAVYSSVSTAQRTCGYHTRTYYFPWVLEGYNWDVSDDHTKPKKTNLLRLGSFTWSTWTCLLLSSMDHMCCFSIKLCSCPFCRKSWVEKNSFLRVEF